MKKLNIEYIQTTSTDYDSRSAPFEAMVQFVLKYFNPPPKNDAAVSSPQ